MGEAERRGVVGWMMPKASFSPAPFFFFCSSDFFFKLEILLVNSWAHPEVGLNRANR